MASLLWLSRVPQTSTVSNRDLERLRNKWKSFCEGRSSASPAAESPSASAPLPQPDPARAPANSRSSPSCSAVADTDDSSSWAFLAGCMETKDTEHSTAPTEDFSSPAGDCSRGVSPGLQTEMLYGGEYGRPHYAEDCFSACCPQRGSQRPAGAGSVQTLSESCTWEQLSWGLEDLSEADVWSPAQLPRSSRCASECGQPEGADLFNALQLELSWDEVIEQFMQPDVADEIGIIEQFMQPAGAGLRPERDMYQYYMQRGRDAQRTAVS